VDSYDRKRAGGGHVDDRDRKHHKSHKSDKHRSERDKKKKHRSDRHRGSHDRSRTRSPQPKDIDPTKGDPNSEIKGKIFGLTAPKNSQSKI
jgi:hypothetical protein